jgi:ribosomal protein S18 acetylase RimI-like enzyme
MLVRMATLEESERVAQLFHDLSLHHASYHPLYHLKEDSYDLSLAYIKGKIERSTSGDGLVLVAEEEEIVGFLTCSIIDNCPNTEIRKMGHIGEVYVIPAYRRRGIAAAMMKEALKWMKERNVEYAELNVVVQNAAAIKAYMEMGFKPNQCNLVQKL